MRQKLNLITLGVENLQKSIKFYCDGLGWKPSEKSNDNLILFPLGVGMTLALYDRKRLAEDTTLQDCGHVGHFHGLTLAFNAKSEEEVDQVLKQVENSGGKIVKTAQKVFWGGYSGYFTDLDGHVFEVAFNPFWNMDENDNLVL
ncbi:predicted protein [Naegleria gruberi]|uniref:Predicted protein n=1 Tax=Naegleria gruberi TaxID=5762 RepID=D2VT01_NAEGR|nr:uncharacterized protein NAEGRDRAFT_72124 [Naegleria gruberi]EFC39994.1 predicted protein [Naegleria gruberi]|eukprot:XP_002672738.1 predicted protein [Naegleria gruberi strain NEG-M]